MIEDIIKQLSDSIKTEKEKFIHLHKNEIRKNQKLFNNGYSLGMDHAITILNNWVKSPIFSQNHQNKK